MAETVLTLGNTREALTVIRSLGRAGCDVIAGRVAAIDLTEFAAATTRSWQHPHPESEPEAFLEALADLEATVAVDWIFPIGETSIRAFANSPGRFPRERLAMVDHATALECLDKSHAYELASDLGIPVPTTIVAVGPAAIADAARHCGYPCVIKANDSTERVAGEKALICADAPMLEAFARTASDDLRVVVQSFAPGHRVNCEFAAWDGELLCYFEHVVLRTDTANGTGYLVDTVSCEPTIELRRHTTALARHFRYGGVGTAQFLVDGATGSCAFLELNPRLDAACALSSHCGCDFPRLALEIARYRAGGRRDRPVSSNAYPIGVRANWLLGDLRGLGRHRRRPGTLPPRTRVWLARAARSFLAADCHTIWSWQDPGPALHAYLGLPLKRAPTLEAPPRAASR